MPLRTCVCVVHIIWIQFISGNCYVIKCCIKHMQSQKYMRDRYEEDQIIISCYHMLASRTCIPRKRFPVQRDAWCKEMQRDAWCKTKEMGGAPTDWEIRKGQNANLQILRPLDSTSMFPRTYSWALTVPWTRTNTCSKTCCKFIKACWHKIDIKLA